MTPDEIVAKFATAINHFEPITEQPSDTDLTRLRKDVALLLLQIPYDKMGGEHNLIGIIWSKSAYVKHYVEAFPEPKRVRAYDLEIDNDATAVVRARKEDAHKARRADRATFETATTASMECVVFRRAVSKVARSARLALCAASFLVLTWLRDRKPG